MADCSDPSIRKAVIRSGSACRADQIRPIPDPPGRRQAGAQKRAARTAGMLLGADASLADGDRQSNGA